MSVRVLHFDVFTAEPGKGNPAGVVLSADGMTDDTMQDIARATGFPDTAFVSSTPEADFRIRYFSTRRETELCRDATIAASIALHTRGSLAGRALPLEFSLATKAGTLPIRIETGVEGETLVVMTQAPSQFRCFEGNRDKLARALSIAQADLHPTLPVIYGSTGKWTLVVPVRGLEVMRRMVPKPQQYDEVLTAMPDASSAYHRTFIEDDTASAQPLVVEQGCEIGREGRVLVWAERNERSYAVRIAGTACFIEAQLY